jgi:enoyl-CoA hydratase/carnithine racemase
MFDLAVSTGIATVTMNRPPVNAISADWLRRFHEILDELGGRHDWSVLHIRSAGKVFCGGADLGEMRARFESGVDPEAFGASTRAIHDVFDRIEALPQVTLAEIGGAAMGARLGLIPGAGGTQRLTRLAGPGVAARIILGCEIVDGATACTLGLVQWSVPEAELEGFAAAVSERIGALPGHAVAAAKSCLAATRDPSRDGFSEEIEATKSLVTTSETRKLVAAFLEGRR